MNKIPYYPESLMMSYGYQAAEHQGAVKCPLFQTLLLPLPLHPKEKPFLNLRTDFETPEKEKKWG